MAIFDFTFPPPRVCLPPLQMEGIFEFDPRGVPTRSAASGVSIDNRVSRDSIQVHLRNLDCKRMHQLGLIEIPVRMEEIRRKQTLSQMKNWSPKNLMNTTTELSKQLASNENSDL